jgi:type II secretory pathway pseudopilin PulG
MPAFTIFELLAVITIITVLLTLLLPSLRQARHLTIRAKCTAQHKQIAQMTYQYAADHRGRLPPPGMGMNAPYYTSWDHNTGQGNGFYLLTHYMGGALDDHWPPPYEADGEPRIPPGYTSWKMFNCPNVPDLVVWIDHGGGGYAVSGQINQFFSQPPGVVPGSSDRLRELPGRFPMFTDYNYSFGNIDYIFGSNHDYPGPPGPGDPNDWFEGANAARADGSADWTGNAHPRDDHFTQASGGGSGRWWVMPKYN